MNNQLLMIQGTTSDAGKSTIVAGLCRILKRRNISVAPFKPQNMALNSAVTYDGGEIGRAQALQAVACGIEPSVHMNPILLKPSSDTGAQVIVQGKALHNMEAKKYHNYKERAMDAVLDSCSRLCQSYTRVLVEGAGSPAEINLRENDIANMGFAEKVDCPVIIVADIDRGGVFAHLVGTLALLSETEQERVIGFVINRFRGDIRLLDSGLEWLEKKTGKPVLGVVPYLHDLYLDAEDAISVNQSQTGGNDTQSASILNVVVPVLSRISNHTDFDVLRLHPNVNLQFCSLTSPIPNADLIIIPGTKNVRKDADLFKHAGWQDHILRHLRYGGKVMGICGGFQILGKTINDPEGIEDKPGVSEGLGLLNCSTTLMPEKALSHTEGRILIDSDDVNVKGYEIHCGQTISNEKPFVKIVSDEEVSYDGAIANDNNIIGTYLHGLFDSKEACDKILNWAGLKSQCAPHLSDIREHQLDRLADALEQCLNLNSVFPGINFETSDARK